MSVRVERLQSRIKVIVSTLLQRHVKDPRAGFVTVTRVQLTGDLKHCKVYVSVLGDEGEVSRVLHFLEHATGHFSTEVARRLTTRQTPRIHFVYDPSVAGVIRISRLIDDALAESAVASGAPASSGKPDTLAEPLPPGMAEPALQEPPEEEEPPTQG
ncbi:MAG: 30S ribosome-binding factor RbfA [Planctomycetes bacterium]|nr:30S ribosome-binding factor RbfA [Planctomycetota bacterium]